MTLKQRKSWIYLIVLACTAGLLFIAVYFRKPQINKNLIKENAFIAYLSGYNYRQTKNDCGPFNVAAVVRALKNGSADSNSFAQKISWRLPNKYTLPWGLENQLIKNGIKIEKPHFNQLNDDEKIEYVQQLLSLGNPIIILGERDGYEHYMTLLGFNSTKNEFYLYDSLQTASTDEIGMTTDENGHMPGNITLNTQEIFDFWAGGGMYGLWKWYGLVASL